MPLYLTFPDWIKPEVFPGFPVRWYGLMYVVAFLVTNALFTWQVKRSGLSISSNTINNFFFSSLLGMVIGARIFATLIYADNRLDYLSQPWRIFWPFTWDGQFKGFAGMSFHGGLLGAVVIARKVPWGMVFPSGEPVTVTEPKIPKWSWRCTSGLPPHWRTTEPTRFEIW